LLGNHDFPFSRSPFAKLKNAIYLQNENYEFEGVKFFGSPQQLPFYGAFNSPESCLERIYKKCDKDVDVLITHTPPYGVLDESSRGVKIGSKSLMSLIEEVKPKVHVFGHVHFGYGEFDNGVTRFFNASQCGK
jgi:Icc-related predicted phosphoesterase